MTSCYWFHFPSFLQTITQEFFQLFIVKWSQLSDFSFWFQNKSVKVPKHTEQFSLQHVETRLHMKRWSSSLKTFRLHPIFTKLKKRTETCKRYIGIFTFGKATARKRKRRSDRSRAERWSGALKKHFSVSGSKPVTMATTSIHIGGRLAGPHGFLKQNHRRRNPRRLWVSKQVLFTHSSAAPPGGAGVHLPIMACCRLRPLTWRDPGGRVRKYLASGWWEGFTLKAHARTSAAIISRFSVHQRQEAFY